MTDKEINEFKKGLANAFKCEVSDIRVDNDAGILQVYIKPPTPIEYLDIQFKLLPDGADFDDFIA